MASLNKPPSKLSARELAMMGVQAQFDRYHKIVQSTGYQGHDKDLMKDIKLIDASIGPPESLESGDKSALIVPPNVLATVVFSMLIDEKYGNLNGVLHGGAVGVIMDMVTTAAIGPMTRPGYWEFLAGVTRTLSVNYLKAVPVGTLVHLHGHLYGLGKTMAFIKGYITSPDGKIVYTTCDINKVNTPAKPHHMKHRISWDDLWDDKGNAKL